MKKSDFKQIAVGFECSIRVMGQNTLGKEFAELYAFLIEAVDIPQESLEHDLVLEMGEECAKASRVELVAMYNAGRTTAFEMFVLVFVVLATGKGYNLCDDIGTEFFLAGASFNDHVYTGLVLFKADKLHGHYQSSLMEELVEGVLSVGSGLTEDDRSGYVI